MSLRRSRKRLLPLGVVCALVALLALAPMTASGNDEAVAAAEEGATGSESEASDLFYLTPAAGAALKTNARPPTSRGAAHDQLVIRVLSNRADLISAGDALVEVVLPEGVRPAEVRVSVDGRDVTDAFALRADGTFSGLVTGLAVGENEVLGRVLRNPQSNRPAGCSSATLTITNHPKSGPVLTGTQIQRGCARTRRRRPSS